MTKRIYVTVECPKCRGKGTLEIVKRVMSCAFCNGSGRISGWKLNEEMREV